MRSNKYYHKAGSTKIESLDLDYVTSILEAFILSAEKISSKSAMEARFETATVDKYEEAWKENTFMESQ